MASNSSNSTSMHCMLWYHHTYLGHGFAHGDAEFLLDGLELIALVIHEGRAGLLYLRCHGVLGTRYGSCGLVAWGVCYATSRTDSSRKNDNNKAVNTISTHEHRRGQCRQVSRRKSSTRRGSGTWTRLPKWSPRRICTTAPRPGTYIYIYPKTAAP